MTNLTIIYKKHNWNDNWNEKHEFYGFIIKDIFDILLNEILQFFSSKNLQSDKLINHIKLKFERWYEPEDRKMLSNIINDFLNKKDIYQHY